jgi:phosphoserine phosphatase RsbU/P
MGKLLRVLMVEDAEDDVLLTVRALKMGGYDPVCVRVETAEAMRRALRNKPWDVILCDYQMPYLNGLTAIALLKETGVDIPLIIVSGVIGEEMAVECIGLGARDFFIKGNLTRLASAVARELDDAESRRRRRQAEKSLQEYKAILTKTEKIGKVGGWELNIDTGKQRWTEGIYNIHEVDFKAETTAEEELNFYAPASRPIIEWATQQSIEQDKPFNVELEIITAKGNLRNVHAIVTADLKRHRVYGFFQDITERKKAEEAFRESEEKHRLVVENAIEAIFVIQEGLIKFVNPASVKLLGYSKEDLILAPFTEFIHPEDLELVSQNYIKRLKGEDLPSVYPFKVIAKDRTVKWVEVHAVVIDWEGKPATLNFLHEHHRT